MKLSINLLLSPKPFSNNFTFSKQLSFLRFPKHSSKVKDSFSKNTRTIQRSPLLIQPFYLLQSLRLVTIVSTIPCSKLQQRKLWLLSFASNDRRRSIGKAASTTCRVECFSIRLDRSPWTERGFWGPKLDSYTPSSFLYIEITHLHIANSWCTLCNQATNTYPISWTLPNTRCWKFLGKRSTIFHVVISALPSQNMYPFFFAPFIDFRERWSPMVESVCFNFSCWFFGFLHPGKIIRFYWNMYRDVRCRILLFSMLRFRIFMCLRRLFE